MKPVETIQRPRATIIPAAAGFSILNHNAGECLRYPVISWLIEEGSVHLAVCVGRTFDVRPARTGSHELPNGLDIVLEGPTGGVYSTSFPNNQWHCAGEWLLAEFGVGPQEGDDE